MPSRTMTSPGGSVDDSALYLASDTECLDRSVAKHDLSRSLNTSAVLRVQHRLASSGLFSDEALVRVFDACPAKDLIVLTMGAKIEDGWRQGSVGDLSGAAILDAVKRGRLWLNVKSLHKHVPAFGELLHRMYDDLADAGQTKRPAWTTLGLVISSAGATVPYHVDAVPNALWQLRGRKRVWIYPPRAPFISEQNLERICAGEQMEEVPYAADFDASARVVDLAPGQAVFWPQHSPHRVENLEGLNISVSTEHLVPSAKRLVRVIRANHIARKRFGLAPRSRAATGVRARLKSAVALCQSFARKAFMGGFVSYDQTAEFFVDPSAADGVRWCHKVSNEPRGR